MQTQLEKSSGFFFVIHNLLLKLSEVTLGWENLFDRVEKVMTKLLECNQDDENIRKKNWTISVQNQNPNAYVNANGRITITTGMLEICDN